MGMIRLVIKYDYNKSQKNPMNQFTQISEIIKSRNDTKVKLVPHEDNKNPDKFKKFHAFIDGVHVGSLKEIGVCPKTHVPQPGYKTQILSTGKYNHCKTKNIASEWIKNNYQST